MDRHALVIGVSAYDRVPLPNAVNDANRVASALALRGFRCDMLVDAEAADIDDALLQFEKDPGGGDLSLIYFAGHGLEEGGSGYILPRDFPFPLSPSGLEHRAVSIARLSQALSEKAGSRVLVLDACRNSYAPSRDDALRLSEQLDGHRAREVTWRDLMIIFSTSAGDRAWDGTDINSPFCVAFCETIVRHGLSLDESAHAIGQRTIELSSRRQRPWYYSSLKRRATFSDLKTFDVFSAHVSPLNADYPLMMGAASRDSRVLVAGGSSAVWAAGPDGLLKVTTPRSAARLVAACVLPNGVACLDEHGELLVGIGNTTRTIRTGTTRPFGLFQCGSERLIVHGSDGWGVYDFALSRLEQVLFRRTRWAVHAGAFVPGDAAWLGGAYGRRVRVDSIAGSPRPKRCPALPHNINTISPTPDGYVLFGGDAGFLAKLHPSTGKLVCAFPRSAKAATMARRRQSLAYVINDDERITRFLTRPDTIDPRIAEILENKIDQSRVLFADVAPTLPIIASANDEGIVELIDARDNQTFQTIDIDGGVGGATQGLRFLSDTMFATMSAKGVVRFHVSEYSAPTAVGPFLASEAEDQLLINSGLD